MDDTVTNENFDAKLSAAIAESEAEEKAYLDARNGGLDSSASETTSDEPTIEELKARIAELEAGKTTGEENTEGNEEVTSDEQPKDGEETTPEEINGVQITEDDYTAWAPFYEALRAGNDVPDEAFALAKERFGVTDRQMVLDYMRGAVSRSDAAGVEYANSVRSAAGGNEGYDGLMAWAAENLSPAEIDAYDTAVNSKNKDLAVAKTEALMFRMKAEGGVPPKLLNGKTNAVVTDVFTNMDEMVRATNDPRYDKDPAYRKAVEAKMERSSNAQSVKLTRGSRAY